MTNVTTYSYIHTAYVTTTLRSPNGRTATRAWVSALNSIRADVSLAWDSTDLGNYISTSTHKAYCTQMGWFINGTTSTANCNVCPVPTNFRETGWSEPYDGVLRFTYAWDSSIGTPAELTACTEGEYVTYPGGNPYYFPSPPWASGQAEDNPTTTESSATGGGSEDTHLPRAIVPPLH